MIELIQLKTDRELDIMREAGKISAIALQTAGKYVHPGITTAEIDDNVKREILALGAKPSFLDYCGYPASTCISVNEVVIHGIPSRKKVLREGDIVSVDVGAIYNGFQGDNAATYACGEISEDARKLMDVTLECLHRGIAAAQAGNRIGDISFAVQSYAESFGYGVVDKFQGHGIGREMHEDPSVPNVGRTGHGPRLMPGMTIAIEPMINISGRGVRVLADGWTTVTSSGSLSAHFENTVAIMEKGPEILTLA